jgi:tetraacyldisaccharide 4'-kinase
MRCWWWAKGSTQNLSLHNAVPARCRYSTAASFPIPSSVAALKGRSVLAFAGIGDPNKFFATALDAGIAVG